MCSYITPSYSRSCTPLQSHVYNRFPKRCTCRFRWNKWYGFFLNNRYFSVGSYYHLWCLSSMAKALDKLGLPMKWKQASFTRNIDAFLFLEWIMFINIPLRVQITAFSMYECLAKICTINGVNFHSFRDIHPDPVKWHGNDSHFVLLYFNWWDTTYVTNIQTYHRNFTIVLAQSSLSDIL